MSSEDVTVEFGQKMRDSDDFKTMTLQDRKNVPYNKHAWEVKSSWLSLEVERCVKGGWVSIQMTEQTTHDSGKTQTRTLFLTINDETAMRLGEFLTGAMG